MIRTLLLAGALFAALPHAAQASTLYTVYGVSDDDMLKMRAGPGIGFNVIVGLPNGADIRVYSCERTGATVWCHVALNRAPGLKGYVSQAYIRQK